MLNFVIKNLVLVLIGKIINSIPEDNFFEKTLMQLNYNYLIL